MRAELEAVLGNCKFLHKCQCTTKNSFETEAAPIFYLLDEGGESVNPVKIVYEQSNAQLTVHNPSLKVIHVTKLDKCLITNESSKCEALLFDNSKLFFVEIKSSNAGTRGTKRKKAREQLGNTIALLRNCGIDFDQYDTKAVICFKSTEPRITNSSVNNSRLEFQHKFQVALEERNYIEF